MDWQGCWNSETQAGHPGLHLALEHCKHPISHVSLVDSRESRPDPVTVSCGLLRCGFPEASTEKLTAGCGGEEAALKAARSASPILKMFGKLGVSGGTSLRFFGFGD